ncbi:MAG: ComF family protein [Candidatus Omnitrophica bacterium CG08_land_8_20_14_0_20_41_16]|uniref:Amidophosphoribosyltransferase n=1 Tax=Candidatus Sherwoodlollariibacterium unditelluris TaxID=1974757 RepID=A0A2G9YJD3_9BACT|nr:MAG: amidophosphoribosyltransferase [Candidatus Omnitrophica bacterium CG23_combo_of_CG06-09_8_20_14_all_41_10]PIS34391.1 MAG: ComF family protein [Candidatus Omnitrophica bacterium CG08_land_8_20_14_0_20_41_16]
MLRSLRDIIYPKTCLSCKTKISATTGEELICRKCYSEIKRNLPPFCSSCGRHLEKNNLNKNICPACIKKRLNFDRAFSPCVYDGVIKKLIHEFKYKGKDNLGAALSKIMIDFIKEYNLPISYLDFIIPMPLHKTRLREREFNQAEILGIHIAKEFKKDLVSGALMRHRQTKTQTELKNNERFLNVADSFSITNPANLKGKNLLLIDDVLTTGATSSEAALTLKKAGAHAVFVLTLAN